MRALDALLGKDVVTLIYQQVHTMRMRSLLAEYSERLFQATYDDAHSVFLNWNTEEQKLKRYNFRNVHNYRNVSKAWTGHVWNRLSVAVADLPQNY